MPSTARMPPNRMATALARMIGGHGPVPAGSGAGLIPVNVSCVPQMFDQRYFCIQA